MMEFEMAVTMQAEQHRPLLMLKSKRKGKKKEKEEKAAIERRR